MVLHFIPNLKAIHENSIGFVAYEFHFLKGLDTVIISCILKPRSYLNYSHVNSDMLWGFFWFLVALKFFPTELYSEFIKLRSNLSFKEAKVFDPFGEYDFFSLAVNEISFDTLIIKLLNTFLMSDGYL